MCGSSPLARGLQTELPRRVAIRRIIPARAGFTHWSSPPRSASKDHPRSRGVYRGESGRAARDWGSSPLARGLHVYLSGLMRYHRIIPARAGFTRLSQWSHEVPPDHPRSRGVYYLWTDAGQFGAGSSPLARGLQEPSRRARAPGRIIPARAGFTSPTQPNPTSGPDHPRSRGVYEPRKSSRGGTNGSSPLARGLQASHTPSCTGRRIIPARAGFTPRPPRRRPAAQDHPRSRGVYCPSPRECRRRCWIIPARAGFTPRGLRWCAAVRIIPARAGFTPSSSGPRITRTDHPRSRGVYMIASAHMGSRRGSSPLARGLPGIRRWRRRRSGIIPARAGFTRSRRTRTA